MRLDVKIELGVVVPLTPADDEPLRLWKKLALRALRAALRLGRR